MPTRIDAVEVVEVWGEPEAFDRSLNIGSDVLGRVGDAHAFSECWDTALGGNCAMYRINDCPQSSKYSPHLLKILSRTLYFLMKSPKSFSLTPAW